MARWLDIHEHAVQAFIRPGGEVASLMNEAAREGERLAKFYLLVGRYGSRNGNHIRSGRLYGGTYHHRIKDTGPLTGFVRLGNSAKHAHYFIEGTPAIITGSPYMLVPRRVGAMQRSPSSKGAGSELYASWNARGKKGYKGFFQAQQVRGQKAKPFLEDAMQDALASKGLFLR